MEKRESLPPGWVALQTAAGSQFIFHVGEVSGVEVPPPEEAGTAGACIKVWLRAAVMPVLVAGDVAENLKLIIAASQADRRAQGEESEAVMLRYAARLTEAMRISHAQQNLQ
jgi:hypothetical protein